MALREGVGGCLRELLGRGEFLIFYEESGGLVLWRRHSIWLGRGGVRGQLPPLDPWLHLWVQGFPLSKFLVYSMILGVYQLPLTVRLGGGKEGMKWIERGFLKNIPSIPLFVSLIGRNRMAMRKCSFDSIPSKAFLPKVGETLIPLMKCR
jgi:hypothetical protein